MVNNRNQCVTLWSVIAEYFIAQQKKMWDLYSWLDIREARIGCSDKSSEDLSQKANNEIIVGHYCLFQQDKRSYQQHAMLELIRGCFSFTSPEITSIQTESTPHEKPKYSAAAQQADIQQSHNEMGTESSPRQSAPHSFSQP